MAQERAQDRRPIASHQLELLIDGGEPCRHGLFTHPEIDTSGPIEQVLDAVRQQVAGCLSRGHIPVTLGGEHSLTFGAMMGIKDSLGARSGILQIDAHADLRCLSGPAAFSCQRDASLC